MRIGEKTEGEKEKERVKTLSVAVLILPREVGKIVTNQTRHACYVIR